MITNFLKLNYPPLFNFQTEQNSQLQKLDLMRKNDYSQVGLLLVQITKRNSDIIIQIHLELFKYI